MAKPMFEPHRVDVDDLRTFRDNIVVTDMQFDGRTLQSGIVLLGDNKKSTGIRPRWAKVYLIGPEQTDVTPGQYVLVAHGRWTRGIEIEDANGKQVIRRIDPKDILLVSDEPQFDDTMSDAISGKD